MGMGRRDAALEATSVRQGCPIQQVVQMGQTDNLGRRARRFLPKTSVALERVCRVGVPIVEIVSPR